MLAKREPLTTIWVLCGGPSSEHEVSLSSGRLVCQQINTTGRKVRPVIVTRQGGWLISEKVLSENHETVDTSDDSDRTWLDDFFNSSGAEWNLHPVNIASALSAMLEDEVHCAVLVFHGDYGEDGAVQGFLQTAGISYTGSQVLASAVALNKAVSIATFARVGLNVARSVRVSRENPSSNELAELHYPLFTKPVHGGSSVGVSLVKSPEYLEKGIDHALEFDREALVEEKIEGVEVSCGVVDLIENGVIKATPMPPTLISPTEAEFFDYEAKYVPGKSRDVTPAPLPPDVLASIQECALRAHQALGCEGMSRTDMIVKEAPGSKPVILELQTIPGLTPTSLLPQQCAAVGISFPQLIDHLVEHSLLRSKMLIGNPKGLLK